MSEKPLYSIIICSSNQLYSGTGRVIFDWIIYAASEFKFELVIDPRDKRNYRIARDFCIDHEISLVVLRAYNAVGLIDNILIGLEDYLKVSKPTYLEIHSWANIGLNLTLMDAIGKNTKLLFTPHYQPAWTLPHSERFFLIKAGLARVLQAADCVFCLSPVEMETLETISGREDNLCLIYNGVNTDAFTWSAANTKDGKVIFSLFDFKEPRKRGDLLIAALDESLATLGDIRIRLAGRGSSEAVLNPRLAAATELLGYLSHSDLVAAYHSANLFVLLSDFEAFGIPVAEALCCGVPVVINATPEMSSIFGGLPGVSLVQNTDIGGVVSEICRVLSTHVDGTAIAEAAQARFRLAPVYGNKLEIIKRLNA